MEKLTKPQVFMARIGKRVRFIGAVPCSKCGAKVEAAPVRWHCMAAVDAFVLHHTRSRCGKCEEGR